MLNIFSTIYTVSIFGITYFLDFLGLWPATPDRPSAWPATQRVFHLVLYGTIVLVELYFLTHRMQMHVYWQILAGFGCCVLLFGYRMFKSPRIFVYQFVWNLFLYVAIATLITADMTIGRLVFTHTVGWIVLLRLLTVAASCISFFLFAMYMFLMMALSMNFRGQ